LSIFHAKERVIMGGGNLTAVSGFNI